MPDEQTDADLVELAKDGDDNALQRLVERHLPSIYNFSMRYTGSADDAQDATQETFLKAWRNLERFNPSRAFRPWLFAIARNAATDIMRKRRHIPFSSFDTDENTNVLTETLADKEPLPEEVFEQAASAAQLRGVLEKLKPRDQLILNMHYEEGLSFEEIARILKMPPNTVRSLHRRALISLRKLLPDNATEQ